MGEEKIFDWETNCDKSIYKRERAIKFYFYAV